MAVSDHILKSIEKTITAISSLYENMDYSATITGIVDSNKYQIRNNGEIFVVPNGTSKQFSVGDTVWVHRPNGSKTKQFIIASEDGTGSSGSGGTVSGVSSVDGKTGSVVLSNTYAAKSSEHTHENKSVLDTLTSALTNTWNTAYFHAVSTHARTDATLTESSITNGNIKINGVETKVYELPGTVAQKSDIPAALPASDVYDWAKQPTKPAYTASEVGLGSVDNTSDIDKPVSTAQQAAIDAALQNATEYTDSQIAGFDEEKYFQNFIKRCYPIGTIYTSTESELPEDIANIGTWEQIKDRFLLAAGDTYTAGTTGGAATAALTVENLPSHNHTFTGTEHTHTFTGTAHNHTFTGTAHNHTFTGASHTHTFTGTAHNHSFTGSSANTGSQSASHTHSVSAIGGTTGSSGSHSHWERISTSGSGGSGSGIGGSSGYSGAANANLSTDTGGSHTHSFTVPAHSTGSQSASHTHSFTPSGSIGSTTAGGSIGSTTAGGSVGNATADGSIGDATAGGSISSATADGTIGSTGDGQAFSILPPYEVVYAWKRIA